MAASAEVDLRDREPPVPVPGENQSRWLVLGVLCLALLIVGIDGTIVNVALPHLVRELGATSSQLQWIVGADTIIFAGFLLLAGNTGDRLGRKGCFIGGLALFGAASFMCSRVDSAGTLIIFRGLQGFGAAFVMPATLSVLANVFTDNAERARAISIWAGVSGLGVALGEASTDPALSDALRERVLAPRRAELEHRLTPHADDLRVPVGIAGDLLIGPVYFRAVIRHAPADDDLAQACVAAVLHHDPRVQEGR